MGRSLSFFALVSLLPFLAATACSSKTAPPPTAATVDEGTRATAPAPPAPPEEFHGPFLHALAANTPVWKDPTATTPFGYLRARAEVRGALADLPADARCPEGWFELHDGGFVCGRDVTFDAEHPKLKSAAPLPATEDGLPYTYGYSTGNGTPLYWWVPSRDDRLRYEPWLVPAADRAASTDDAWYLRDWGTARPDVTLGDLAEGGPIARRMVKGFYVSIDTQAKSAMYKTIAGQFAPRDRVALAKPITDFHGVWLGDAALHAPAWPRAVAQENGAAPPYWVASPPTKLPLAFVNGIGSKRWTLDESSHATAGTAIPRFTPVGIQGEPIRVGGTSYLKTDAGELLRESDLVVVRERTAPADIGRDETWVDVDLATQTLVAYVGPTPVFATMVSTGRYRHDTPKGTFYVREKHVSSTMEGDGSNGEGPYAIEDVPWIMYFEGGYALHGAFWHSNFGHRQSHGCVNLSPDDARALFYWSEPKLPAGFHGITADAAGRRTRVVIH